MGVVCSDVAESAGEGRAVMFEQFRDAGIDVGKSYGRPAGQKLFTALYTELTGARGYSGKPVLLGRSRGGLMTLSWAASNPDKVGGFAGIYPVCDLASYPGASSRCRRRSTIRWARGRRKRKGLPVRLRSLRGRLSSSRRESFQTHSAVLACANMRRTLDRIATQTAEVARLRSCPHAASMSGPRARRKCATAPWSRSSARNASVCSMLLGA